MQAHEKVCDEIESRRIRKNDTRVKMFFMEGRDYKVHVDGSCHGCQQALGQ